MKGVRFLDLVCGSECLLSRVPALRPAMCKTERYTDRANVADFHNAGGGARKAFALGPKGH